MGGGLAAGWPSMALLTCLLVRWLSAKAIGGGEGATAPHGPHSPAGLPGIVSFAVLGGQD